MFAIVFITVRNEDIALRIASDLVGKRLAACANFFPNRSFYRWKGRVETADERILLLKIGSSDFALVPKEILAMHPDEVPCIVKREIDAGHQAYLDWIKESTERPDEDSDRR